MGLRYCIRPATSVDMAFLATVLDESRDPWDGGGDVPIDRLLQTCACSAQVWAARDTEGTPTALWGVAPAVGRSRSRPSLDAGLRGLRQRSRRTPGTVAAGVRRDAEPVPPAREFHRFAQGARHRAAALHRLCCRAGHAANRPPTPTSIACGSIRTDCITGGRASLCPTDDNVSFHLRVSRRSG